MTAAAVWAWLNAHVSVTWVAIGFLAGEGGRLVRKVRALTATVDLLVAHACRGTVSRELTPRESAMLRGPNGARSVLALLELHAERCARLQRTADGT
jgi:hypothetical protein